MSPTTYLGFALSWVGNLILVLNVVSDSRRIDIIGLGVALAISGAIQALAGTWLDARSAPGSPRAGGPVESP